VTDYQTWVVEFVELVSSPQTGTSLALDTDNDQTAAISWGSSSASQGPRLVVAGPGQFFGWDGVAVDGPGGAFGAMKWIGGKLAVAHQDPISKDLRFTKHD
jgi:hypothetical protein